jgi:DNA-binding NarL/FixJ family response regulator
MRILVADDNDRIRAGVIGLLSSEGGWVVCGEARDGAEAIGKARELRPDVILVDVRMPGVTGLEVARVLRQEVPETKILIISQHDPGQLLPRAIAAGADASLDKARLATDLLPAIKRVCNL